MKRLLLTVLSTLTLGVAANAQDQVEIYLQGQTTDLSSGNGPHQVVVSTSSEISTYFDVKNISGSQKSWKMTRFRVSEVTGWTDYMCWETCFTAAAMPTNPWTAPALILDDGATQVLNTYVTPDAGNPGTALYRYYVSEDGINYVDSVDLEITFALDVAAITPEVTVNVSPNPATDYVTIKTSGSESGTVRVVDVLGNIILKESFSGNKKLNVSTFRNGVYFVIIEPEGGKVVNRKIVVRH